MTLTILLLLAILYMLSEILDHMTGRISFVSWVFIGLGVIGLVWIGLVLVKWAVILAWAVAVISWGSLLKPVFTVLIGTAVGIVIVLSIGGALYSMIKLTIPSTILWRFLWLL